MAMNPRTSERFLPPFGYRKRCSGTPQTGILKVVLHRRLLRKKLSIRSHHGVIMGLVSDRRPEDAASQEAILRPSLIVQLSATETCFSRYLAPSSRWDTSDLVVCHRAFFLSSDMNHPSPLFARLLESRSQKAGGKLQKPERGTPPPSPIWPELPP